VGEGRGEGESTPQIGKLFFGRPQARETVAFPYANPFHGLDKMESLAELFQHVCSQGRCFSIGEAPLPVCQRCLGLYAGFAVTVVWLTLSGIGRRGLAPNGILALHVGVLLAAMAGGLHWIDPGPRWRLTCGLWTGHVAAMWLLGGTVEQLRLRSLRPERDGPASAGAWPRSCAIQAVVALPLLSAAALAFPALAGLGWWFWTLLAATGLVLACLSVAGSAAMLALGAWAGLRRAR